MTDTKTLEKLTSKTINAACFASCHPDTTGFIKVNLESMWSSVFLPLMEVESIRAVHERCINNWIAWELNIELPNYRYDPNADESPYMLYTRSDGAVMDLDSRVETAMDEDDERAHRYRALENVLSTYDDESLNLHLSSAARAELEKEMFRFQKSFCPQIDDPRYFRPMHSAFYMMDYVYALVAAYLGSDNGLYIVMGSAHAVVVHMPTKRVFDLLLLEGDGFTIEDSLNLGDDVQDSVDGVMAFQNLEPTYEETDIFTRDDLTPWNV